MERAFLERRNALWQQLRRHSPGEPDADAERFAAALGELSELIHWPPERILAGLGLSGAADLASAPRPPNA